MDSSNSSKKKKQKPSKPVVVQETADNNEDENEPLEVRFERELAWAKDQIFQKLHHVKLDSKQGYDLARALKILNSDKAAMIKKRQAMRSALGDYHKKMKEDEKKSAAAAKNITLKPADTEQTKLSRCLKLSSSLQKQNAQENGDSEPTDKISSLSLDDSSSQSETVAQCSSFKFEKTNNDFRFDFTSETGAGSGDKTFVNGEAAGDSKTGLNSES